ncbi:MAG: hypothetical protein ACN6OP_13880 [Pseudomonadales bacterium]
MKAVHVLLESSAQRQLPTERQGPFSRLSSLAWDRTILPSAGLAVIGVGLIILGTE